MKVAVEVSVTGLDQALRALALGADRVELCAWPECGGVTPSAGLVAQAYDQLTAPPRILLRPTPGGFRYGAMATRIAQSDLQLLHQRHPGCHIVTGALNAESMPDTEWMRAMRNMAPGCLFTFHRALDVASRFETACDRVLAMGVDRVLTSGGADNALAGAPAIARLVSRAPAHMIIAAAGKVNASNAVELVERTGVREIHFAATTSLPLAMRPGLDDDRLDEAKVEGVLEALAKAGLR